MVFCAIKSFFHKTGVTDGIIEKPESIPQKDTEAIHISARGGGGLRPGVTSVEKLFATLMISEIVKITCMPLLGVLFCRILVYGAIFLFGISALNTIIRTIDRVSISLLLLLGISLLVSLLRLSREEGLYTLLTLRFPSRCLPMFFIGKAIAKNNKNLTKILKLCPIIATVACSALSTMPREAMYGDIEYSMSLGYALLPASFISVYYVLRGHIHQTPFALLLFYFLLTSGTRGPVLVLLLSALIVMGHFLKLNSFRSWLMISLGAVVAIFFVLNWEYLLGKIIVFFMGQSMSIRTLRTLASGTFMKSDARLEIFKTSLQGIDEYALIGTGIFQDRQYIHDHVNALLDSAESVGSYSHNIFLELLLQFGIFIGGVAIVCILYLLFKGYRKCKEKDGKFFIYLLLVCIGFFPLMISNTWLDSSFFMMLGFMVGMLKMKN